MIGVIYAIGFVATFFGMKLIDDFKESDWPNLFVRFICALFAPISWFAILIMLILTTKYPSKPPKWL